MRGSVGEGADFWRLVVEDGVLPCLITLVGRAANN